jgi:NTE family protein
MGRAPVTGLALALSGGGAPAAYFCAGVIQELAARGLLEQVRVVSGTSAGALNAGAVASGLSADELAEMWVDARLFDLVRPRLDVWRLVNWRNAMRWPTTNLVEYLLDAVGWTWLVDTGGARRWLVSHLCDPSHPLSDDAKDGRIPIRRELTVIVSAVDQATGKVVRFTNGLPDRRPQAAATRGSDDAPYRRSFEYRRVDLTVDHLLASAAVPLLLRPGMDQDHEYVDAGLVANTPLTPVFDYRPDAVIVVSAASVTGPAARPASLGDALARLMENVARYSIYSSYEHAQAMNAVIRQAPDVPLARGKKKVELVLIEPIRRPSTVTGFLDFSPDVAHELMRHGRERARQGLRDWSALDRATSR